MFNSFWMLNSKWKNDLSSSVLVLSTRVTEQEKAPDKRQFREILSWIIEANNFRVHHVSWIKHLILLKGTKQASVAQEQSSK